MGKEIVCFDADHDVASKLVADWRHRKLYPTLKKNILELRGNMAIRHYLKEALNNKGVAYFSASGHGEPEGILGNDGDFALQAGNYNPEEVSGKIIHLLSCDTAQTLGSDCVANGYIAFFGYDFPFTFHGRYLDEFMAPDAEVDVAISNEESVEIAHNNAVKMFEHMEAKLLKAKADFSVIGDLMTNKAHFCSAVKHPRWGDPSCTI